MSKAHPTPEAVLAAFGEHARGKTIFITGANSGLGLETARNLAKANVGASLILACRSAKNGEEAVAKILAESPTASVTNVAVDLADQSSIAAFCKSFAASGKRIDILINNAGVMALPLPHFTADGFEMQWGTNHLGTFALTAGLLPCLASPCRVVNLSSVGAWIFSPPEGIPFGELDGRGKYDAWRTYGVSKLANQLHVKELQRLSTATASGITAVSLHPGGIPSTNLMRHTANVKSMFNMLCYPRAWGLLTNMSTLPQGSARILVAALDPAVVPGAYYEEGVLAPGHTPAAAADPALAAKLWTVSEEAVASALAEARAKGVGGAGAGSPAAAAGGAVAGQ